jgi:hypothetical protein
MPTLLLIPFCGLAWLIVAMLLAPRVGRWLRQASIYYPPVKE